MQANKKRNVTPNKMLANGRTSVGVPKAENWYARIHIYGLVESDTWRNLTKTATDMLIISIAKNDKAAAFGQKINGRPRFTFSVSEGQRVLHISRPTFTRAMKELIDKGFIEVHDPGGIENGKGRAAQYMLSGEWKNWVAPKRNNQNILKARKMRRSEKENRS